MDYYQLLDIPRVASPDDIENRYHELAKKYHPDRSKSPDAHEKFIKIKEAYETLKNPHKRKAYDAALPPEEKAMEASFEPGNSGDFSSGSEPSAGDPPIPPVPEEPVQGSRGAYKSTSISYVSFKSDHDSYPAGSASSSETSGESGKTDWSRYVSSKKSSNPHDRSKEVSSGAGQNDADWSYVKVKYEGMDDDSDEDAGKHSGWSAFFLKKAFRYTVVLICIFLVLIIVSPDLVGAQASGLGAVTETFDKVLLLAKSLV